MEHKIKVKIAIIAMSISQGLQFTIAPVLDKVQEAHPDVNVSSVQMLVTAPAIMSLVVALISGWLIVKISKKNLIVFGTFILGLTGFVPFISESFGLLFVCKTIMGIGLGIITALNTAVVAEHFEGKERLSTMGIQGASVGVGMLLANTLGGILGANDFRGTYYVHVIGFIAMVIIMLFLPETGKAVPTHDNKIKLTAPVFKIGVLGMIEYIFLMTFSTNIAMHLSGSLAGNSSVTGTLTGAFSAIQIVAGLTLGFVAMYTRKNTLALAMLSFGIGSLILVFFSGTYVMLFIAALFCGMSQGYFVPRAMCEVSDAVTPISAALAAAVFTVFTYAGQILSAPLLNGVSKIILGETSTTNVYILSAIGMIAVPVVVIIMHGFERNKVK